MSGALTRRRFGALLGAIPLASLPGTKAVPAGSRTHEISIHRFKFEPAELTIRAGDQVVWTNQDIAPHTATELDAHLWDTGKLTRNQSGAITLDEPGTYPYFCVFHPRMRGVVRVEG